MKYTPLLFFLTFGCIGNADQREDLAPSTPGNTALVGKWVVVGASIEPFDHPSFCRNLTLQSVFEFQADSTFKVMDGKSGTYCNLELPQRYSLENNIISIAEWDFLFQYHVKLLTQDSLVFIMHNTPQRYYLDQQQVENVRAQEMRAIDEQGILVTLIRKPEGK